MVSPRACAGSMRCWAAAWCAGTDDPAERPRGVGKTTTAIRCMVAALRSGERAAFFLFDERLPTLLMRSAALGMDLEPYIDRGQLDDPSDRPGRAVARRIRHRGRATLSRTTGAKVIVIDSLNAYLQAMPEEQDLTLQMHELLTYLGQQA